ncbi:MAG: hypothetical protein MZV64_10580 [Ignavibacteriales bacterium]|nr:hypothetical protein [Ignavibacteriales bacterium]
MRAMELARSRSRISRPSPTTRSYCLAALIGRGQLHPESDVVRKGLDGLPEDPQDTLPILPLFVGAPQPGEHGQPLVDAVFRQEPVDLGFDLPARDLFRVLEDAG